MVEHFKISGQLKKEINSNHAAYLIDSYMTLYAYTLVSKHHRMRFDSFFNNNDTVLTDEQRISIVMDSIRMFLA